ncbi:MAG: hypothetical protein R3F19_00010 [Verrucomicrobiales bacterium]
MNRSSASIITLASIASLVAYLFTAPACNAEVLVNWDFSGIPAADAGEENMPQPNPLLEADAANAAVGITASALDHLGLVYSTAVSPGGVGTSIEGELNIKNFDRGGDGINDNYMFFTLTAEEGKTLSITSIVIDVWRNGAGAPDGMAFDVSVDGGDFELFGDIITVDDTGGGEYVPIEFNRSITDATSVEIRFTPRNATAGSTGNLHINGLRVEGEVVTGSGLSGFAILDIANGADGSVTLTWRSKPGDDVNYTVLYSGDLAKPASDWSEANDSIPSAGEETTYEIPASSLPVPRPESLYFVVKQGV